MWAAMPQTPAILDHRLDFDSAEDFEQFLQRAPGKWAVYLFTDADENPIQLLCVKNLRASLKRRLSGEQTLMHSKRVEYRQIVRRIYFRRVDSALEADWVYHDAARQIFPQTYQGMVGFRPAWFVHVDPDIEFPRYAKTIDLTKTSGIYFGPLEDKHSAGKLVEQVEDWFDLCRYYQILIQSPKGRACAYKEMGKCPAPCDGSISMDQYRAMIHWSMQTLTDPREMVRDQTQRMRDAAADLRFETAAKIKTFADEISQIGKGPLRHLRPLKDFAFVSLQNGPWKGCASVFVIVRGQIEQIASIVNIPSHPADLLRTILATAQKMAEEPIDLLASERIGIVTHHLFTSRQTHGVYLPLADITESAVAQAYRDLGKQKLPEESEAEGVMKELQALE
jgi:excinuclease UvrABC nuclease subunit